MSIGTPKRACVESTPSVAAQDVAREFAPEGTTFTHALAGQRVKLTAQRLHRGGLLWQFVCPGCGGKCWKLYKPPGCAQYACRKCHCLAFRSTQTRHKDVAIARRLGLSSVAEMDRLFPPTP